MTTVPQSPSQSEAGENVESLQAGKINSANGETSGSSASESINPAVEANASEETKPSEPHVEEVTDPLQAAQDQAKEWEQKYLYLYAEFDNYKKRMIKEKSDLSKFGWEPVARDILEVLDNMERALEHVSAESDQGLVDGLNMVQRQFVQAIEKRGVQPVESLGQTFDPNVHEAVAQSPSEEPEGQVIHVQQKGYLLHGRLLRPARVVVSNGQKPQAAEEKK